MYPRTLCIIALVLSGPPKVTRNFGKHPFLFGLGDRDKYGDDSKKSIGITCAEKRE